MPNWIKNILMTLLLVALVVSSFWISFSIGKKMLTPVRKLPSAYLVTPEATPGLPIIDNQKVSIEVDGLNVPIPPPPPIKNIPEPQANPMPLPAPIVPAAAPAITSHPKALKKTTAMPAALSGKYVVQTGLFSKKSNAQNLINGLAEKGFEGRIEKAGKYLRVVVGDNLSLSTASEWRDRLVEAGFEAQLKKN
jgi:cell division protein FtsN